MTDNILYIPRATYERRKPTNIDEAITELDRRFMIEAKESSGHPVKARVIFRELLEDYTEGLQSSSSYIMRM